MTRTLTDIWPFFGLTISTPRVTLSYPNDDTIPALIALADGGIHSSDRTPFMRSWSLEEPDVRSKVMAQFHWQSRATLSPERWRLLFAVSVDGQIAGTQDAFARDFHETKVASTGSWLGEEHQGKGIGTEMRRAILHFIFEGLGAEIAETSAFVSNRKFVGLSALCAPRPTNF